MCTKLHGSEILPLGLLLIVTVCKIQNTKIQKDCVKEVILPFYFERKIKILFLNCILCSVVYLPLSSPQLNSLGVRERLSCLLSAEPRELLLEPTEALRITTEAYRLWVIAAGYGQACQLYM